jgi:hypothetical protein
MSAPIRLERERPAARQAGGALAIGIVLTLLGGGGLALLTVAPVTGRNGWVIYVVIGGFLLVGVLMLILGIKMVLSTRLPETIVEAERMPVRAGKSFQLIVRQPGPIRLVSLRVNLVGEQITKRDVWRNGRRRTETDRRLIHQTNVLDLRDISIARGEEHARQAEAMVPANVTLADIEGRATVVWRLEVWGRVRGWVDFGHPFVISVVPQRRAAAPNNDATVIEESD